MESKFKIFAGFIVSASIALGVHGYYFDFPFFDPTFQGFVHDVTVFFFTALMWAMMGLLGWYKK